MTIEIIPDVSSKIIPKVIDLMPPTYKSIVSTVAKFKRKEKLFAEFCREKWDKNNGFKKNRKKIFNEIKEQVILLQSAEVKNEEKAKDIIDEKYHKYIPFLLSISTSYKDDLNLLSKVLGLHKSQYNAIKLFLSVVPDITSQRAMRYDLWMKNMDIVRQRAPEFVKKRWLEKAIEKLETFSYEDISIKRRKAKKFADSGEVDHNGQYTIFGQVYQKLKGKAKCFKQNGTDSRIFKVDFLGEGSIDAGGPYRECLTNICQEL